MPYHAHSFTFAWLTQRSARWGALAIVLALLGACGGGAEGSAQASKPPAETAQLEVIDLQAQAAAVTASSTVSASFAASAEDFANPERGFFKFGSDLSAIDEGFLEDTAAQGYRLVFTPNHLGPWRTKALPASYLRGLSAGFAKLRKHGLKAIVRFAYNYPQTEAEALAPKDATLSRVQSHLLQLKPILAENADVIAVWQAGFIGAYGEWHTSSNNLTSASNRLAVRDALLAALPSQAGGQRLLQFRNPTDVNTWYPMVPTEAQILTASPSAAARVGLHNDCFLASVDDVGTYFPNNSSALRSYAQTMGAVNPSGGETCAPPDVAQARMGCPDILQEGAAYHMGYLNQDYFADFITNWQAQGCYTDVSRQLGYRIELSTLSHPASAVRGAAVALRMELRNVGWARLMNPRSLVLRLVPDATVVGGTTVTLALADTNLKAVLANATHTFVTTANMPASLVPGRYQMQLGAPDAASSLSALPAYALRFANADSNISQGAQWLPATGFYATGTALTVTAN
jgi:hypothetical protein